MEPQFGSRSRIVATTKPDTEAATPAQAPVQEVAPQATPAQAPVGVGMDGIERVVRGLLTEFLAGNQQSPLATPSVMSEDLGQAVSPDPDRPFSQSGVPEDQRIFEPEAMTTPDPEPEAVAEVAETTSTSPTRDELIDSVFDAEGGYSTDRNDTGNYYRGQFVGTNHGISAPVLAEHLGRTPTVQDMRDLSQDTAREIAATQYYDNYSISDLPDDTQEIVFHAVYMGGSRGVRAVQNLTGATPDGVMGPNTRRAMQESTFTPQEYRDEYLRELEFGTSGYSSPAATWDAHGRGWTNRYNELADN